MYGYKFERALPRLFTYAQAVAHEASVEPIRGDKEGLKPLGLRQHKWLNIFKEDSGVHIRFEDHIVVTFKPDDTIEVYNYPYRREPSAFNEILTLVLGHRFFIKGNIVWVECLADTNNVGSYPVSMERPSNMFKYDPELRRLRYINPVYPVTHRIRRKELAEVRKKYAAFSRYMCGIIKLRGETERTCYADKFRWPVINNQPHTQFTYDEYVEAFGGDFTWGSGSSYYYNPIPGMFGEPEEQYRAVMRLMKGHAHTEKKAKQLLHQYILFIERDHVLEEVTHKDGNVHLDKYQRYF